MLAVTLWASVELHDIYLINRLIMSKNNAMPHTVCLLRFVLNELSVQQQYSDSTKYSVYCSAYFHTCCTVTNCEGHFQLHYFPEKKELSWLHWHADYGCLGDKKSCFSLSFVNQINWHGWIIRRIVFYRLPGAYFDGSATHLCSCSLISSWERWEVWGGRSCGDDRYTLIHFIARWQLYCCVRAVTHGCLCLLWPELTPDCCTTVAVQ